MSRGKKRYKVYVLIALVGIIGVSLAKYITSVQDVEAPKPAAKYPDKTTKAQIKGITVPKAKPGKPVSEYKPQVPSEAAQRRGSQTQELSFSPVISEDKRSRRDEPRRKLPSDEREAESTPKPQAEAPTPAERFNEGKALDDESEEETAAEKLQRADDLSVRAAKRAAEARELCDCEPVREALRLANKAALLVSEVAAEAEKTGNMELAQSAYNVANTIARVLSLFGETCTYCTRTSSEPEIVVCCCDCELVEKLLELADEIASLASEAATEAKNTGNVELAQSIYSIASRIGVALTHIADICRYCTQTSMEVETVACAERNRSKAEEIASLNAQTTETAIAAGAIPGEPEPYIPPETSAEPFVEPDLPFRDHEQPPASPI